LAKATGPTRPGSVGRESWSLEAAMKIELIGEPVGVLATFTGGAAEPLRFRWHGRTYKIERVNAQWVDRQGETYTLNYSVQVGDETYYLHFASAEVQWWLDQVAVEG
jgi:hypothetical protein